MKGRYRRRTALVHVATVPQSVWALLRGQLAYMRERGFDVVVVSSPGPLLDEVGKREGVATLGIPMRRTITPFHDLMALFKLWALFRKLRPAITVVSTVKASLLGSVASYLASVPVRIYGLWGLRLEGTSPPLRWILWLAERLTCATSHRVVCISRSLRERALSLGVVSSGKTVVIGKGSVNGVDASRFRPTPDRRAEGRQMRENLGVPQEAKVLGFVGRLVRDKGVEELVRVFCRIGAQRQDIWLVLVGHLEEGDPVSERTRREIESNSRIVSAGFVKNPEAYYHAMDVAILPTYREGFGNVNLEAACAELPVITTAATGAVDSIVDGITGLLVPPRDSEALQRAIERLLDNPALARRMGKKGRERAERDFRPEIVWNGFLSLYKTMLGARGLPLPSPKERAVASPGKAR